MISYRISFNELTHEYNTTPFIKLLWAFCRVRCTHLPLKSFVIFTCLSHTHTHTQHIFTASLIELIVLRITTVLYWQKGYLYWDYYHQHLQLERTIQPEVNTRFDWLVEQNEHDTNIHTYISPLEWMSFTITHLLQDVWNSSDCAGCHWGVLIYLR